MQGVIKSYDPFTGDGTVIADTLTEYELAPGALDGSVFRMLRQGQRVVFDVTEGRDVHEQPVELATDLRLGSEVDMGTPGFPASEILPTSGTDPLATHEGGRV